MTHTVRNLATGQEMAYVGIDARTAVVCAYEQGTRKNWHTWDYDMTKAILTRSGKHWLCGDWACPA